MSKWFVYDEFDTGYEEFENKEDALKHFHEIKGDGHDGWAQEILDGAIKVGVVLYESCETNRREPDRDDDGEFVNTEFDYFCDVDAVEIECDLVKELATTKKLLDEAVEVILDIKNVCDKNFLLNINDRQFSALKNHNVAVNEFLAKLSKEEGE